MVPPQVFGDIFNEEITRMAQQGNMAGIGFQESADALGALTQGLSSFNPKAENKYACRNDRCKIEKAWC